MVPLLKLQPSEVGMHMWGCERISRVALGIMSHGCLPVPLYYPTWPGGAAAHGISANRIPYLPFPGWAVKDNTTVPVHRLARAGCAQDG